MFFNLTNNEIHETLYFDSYEAASGFISGLNQLLPATHEIGSLGDLGTVKRYGKDQIRVNLTIRPNEAMS